jgi:hypothetical protein
VHDALISTLFPFNFLAAKAAANDTDHKGDGSAME